jgi:integrating conjugative element protein (TIGR03757 family)
MPILPESAPSRGKSCLASFALCGAALCVLLASGASAADVWVITDREHPVAVTPGIRLIELDAPARLEAELSAQLPPDPVRAAAIVRQRLKDGGTDLQRRLAAAYQGVTDAWSLSVVKIPAIIVDRRYVVYGETAIDRALARIDAYRSVRP